MSAHAANTCALIGAGAAGLTAARMLQAQGMAVTVFDKGRKAGGRIASRETAHGSFDHGVQYLAAEGASLRQSLIACCSQGHAASFAVSCIEGTQHFVRHPSIGVPSNHQIAQCWSTGLTVLQEQRVESICRAGPSWQLGIAGQAQPLSFDSVVVTVPQPQLQALLPSLGLPPQLDGIRYHPCWSLLWVPTARELPDLLPFSRVAHESIGWISREDSKPGRNGPPRYVVHATAAWSLKRLEQPAETVAATLQRDAAALLGIAAGAHFFVAHRWRFARVSQSIGTPQVMLAPGLHYASDGCLGDSVEDAMTSGAAAAMALLASRA